MFKEEPMKTSNHCIRRLPLLLATTLGAAALQAHAGLYPPAAPPDSAFIRVFNDTAQGRLDAQLGDKKVPDAAPMAASAYVFMPPGQYDAKIGGKQEDRKSVVKGRSVSGRVDLGGRRKH